jgi:hypothetical protein
MAIVTKKISELPLHQSFNGLYTIGYTDANGTKTSARVSLLELKNAVDAAVAAQQSAASAAQSAASAVSNAATAINKAQTAIDTATTAAQTAGEAANNAKNKANEADSAATNANSVTKNAQQKIDEMEELKDAITAQYKAKPTSMSLEYPPPVPVRNVEPIYIRSKLLPVGVENNVIFISDNKAVSVLPDGRIIPLAVGISRIDVIPTENTPIYQTIQIEVVNSRNLRKTASGAFRTTGLGSFRY